MHIEVSLEATKSDSKCVPPTTTSSLEKETTHQTHDSQHQHEMKQSQCEDDLHTATFNVRNAIAWNDVVDPRWAACLPDENARDGVHRTNAHQGDAACAVCPMHLAEMPNIRQAVFVGQATLWHSSATPSRETPTTASTTDSVLIFLKTDEDFNVTCTLPLFSKLAERIRRTGQRCAKI